MANHNPPDPNKLPKKPHGACGRWYPKEGYKYRYQGHIRRSSWAGAKFPSPSYITLSAPWATWILPTQRQITKRFTYTGEVPDVNHDLEGNAILGDHAALNQPTTTQSIAVATHKRSKKQEEADESLASYTSGPGTIFKHYHHYYHKNC